MSVTSNRQVNVQVSGDGLDSNNSFPAAENASSPARMDYVDLANGANTITTTTGAVALTILPPATNTNALTLKGTTGDTGIPIHPTDPTSIALATTATTLVLTASGTTQGVRLVWS